jgi:hypothetical protein
MKNLKELKSNLDLELANIQVSDIEKVDNINKQLFLKKRYSKIGVSQPWHLFLGTLLFGGNPSNYLNRC